jgi:hypothetical protein
LNAPQQNVATLQTSNSTLSTKVATLKAENATLTTANTNLTAQVATLDGGAVAGGAAGGGTEAATPVIFVATPAMVNHQDLIKYTTKVVMMICGKGYEKNTTEFDMKSNGTVVYITELQANCIKMWWHMGTQQIINFTHAAGSTINVIHQYGQINAAMLQAQCKVFCKSTGALFQARARQNNTMMGECIMKTLMPVSSKNQALTFLRGLQINDMIYAPHLHKKIMALAMINSVATTQTLCPNMRDLPTYCSTIKGDIELLQS